MNNQAVRMASRGREVARLLAVTGSRSCLQESKATILAVGQEARPISLEAPTRPSWTLNDDSWNQWWSYSGVSGPSYWGLLNPDWFMCEKGRRQSPIDINTKALVYDPHLSPLKVDNYLISGVLYNDGHSIVFNGSLAAMTRLVRLQEQNNQQEQQLKKNAIQMQNELNGENSTATRIDHAILRRQTSDIFTLDEHTARVELVGLKSGFVVDTEQNMAADSAPIRSQRPLMLIRELDNNVDLSISESDRLQSESSGMSAESSESTSSDSAPLTDQVHFTGAGTVYSYRFETLQFKFGPSAVSQSSDAGSEHQIDGRSFAGELQLFAYNWQLYKSYDESLTRPHGLLAISILVDLIPNSNQNGNNKGDINGRPEANNQKSSSGQSETERRMTANEQLERLLTSASNSLNNRGAFAGHRDLNLSVLLSELSEQFVTYEGSLTQPGCHETVTWLILNRPLYISERILDKLRLLSSDEFSAPIPTGTLIAGNTRPVQPVNNRPIRTNIRPPKVASAATNMPDQEICPRLWTRYKYSRQNNQPAP